MVIYLSDALITDNPEEVTQIYKCVRNLCIVYEESKHILLGDIHCLEWCREVYAQDMFISHILNQLIQNFSTLYIPSDITEYVKVGKWDDKIVEIQGNIKVHKVPYSFFLDSMECQKTAIIGEDEYDAEFYSQILKWYSKSLPYNYSYEFVHGGGGRTDKRMESVLKERRMVVTIVDTDVRYPGDRIKRDSTSWLCRKADNSLAHSSVSHLHLLEVHELENLMPYPLIASFDWNRENLSHFTSLCDADNNGDILRFFDIKSGIRKKDIVNGNQDFYNFAHKCYNAIPTLIAQCDLDTNLNSHNNDDLIILSLGRPLNKLIEYFRGNDITTVPVDLKQFQEEEWNQIGQILKNFCIARSKESLN